MSSVYPVVSVVIACYNAQQQIGKCLESIITQTFSNIEVIVCDDCSTDQTVCVVEQYIKQDQRITLIKLKQNCGAAFARNQCLKLAKGRYISIQDADDYSDVTRIEQQVGFLEQYAQYAFVSGGVIRFNENEIWGKYDPAVLNPTKRDFLLCLPFVHAATTFRKSALDEVSGYRVSWETKRGQDHDLFMRLYAKGFVGCNRCDYNYYYYQGQHAFKRKKYRYRVGEVVIRYKGYRAMGMLKAGLPYLIKPLIMGLIPKFILKRRVQRVGKRSVRVLQIVSSLGYGGVALSLKNFASGIDSDKVQFDYFTHFGKENYHQSLMDTGSRIYYGKTISKIGMLRYLKQMIQICRKYPYDAIVIHTNYQMGLVAACSKFAGIKVRIGHTRGTYIQNKKIQKKLWVCRMLIRMFLTHRWACSDQTGKFYYGQKAFSRIPEPIDLALYQGTSQEQLTVVRSQLHLPDDVLILGHVGRFSAEKNHRFLLELLKKQLENSPETYLVMAGDGELFEQVRQEFVRLGVVGQCRFLGNYTDIPLLMQLFDLLLLPSESEGMPNVVIQAQAAGTPSVISGNLSHEVDLNMGLVKYAIHNDYSDWLLHISNLNKWKIPPKSLVHHQIMKNGYDLETACNNMQQFFENMRTGR